MNAENVREPTIAIDGINTKMVSCTSLKSNTLHCGCNISGRPLQAYHIMIFQTKERFRWLPEAALLALSLWFFFGNLGSGALWQDEAQTALISESVLRHGVPVGFDGVNSFSQDLGRDHAPNGLWKVLPWFPYYLLAAFFAVLDPSTFTARLPFALFGLSTVALAGGVALRVTGNRRTAFLAALFLTCSVPFLLLSRQSKYFSVASFFSLLALHAWLGTLEGKKWSRPLLAGSLTVLFHTHYLYSIAVFCAFAVHTINLREKTAGRRALKLAAVVLAINLPALAWYGSSYADISNGWPSAERILSFGAQFLYLTARHLVQPFAPALALAILLINRSRRQKHQQDQTDNASVPILLLSFGFITIAALAALSPAPFFRYLAPLAPPAAILLAHWASGPFRASRFLGVVYVVIVLAGNPLQDYFYELTHQYRGPVDEIADYLKQNARPDDVVAITYEDLPLKFYTSLRVVGGLTGEDLTPAKTAQWIILRANAVCEKDIAVSRYLVDNVPWEKYQAVVLNAPDIRYQNRESPDEHLFRTATGGPPVLLFKRIIR